MKKILLPCAALLLVAATALFAQNAKPTAAPANEPKHPPHQPPPLLMALDTDHDGQLSAAEITHATAALKTLDRDGDGILSGDELHPPRPEHTPSDGPSHDGPPPQRPKHS